MGHSLGVGIIGCGGAANDLCAAISRVPEVAVAAAQDRMPEHATGLVQNHGGVIRPTIDSLIEDAGVDVVYVALPHNLLATTAQKALLAGKHVLVEKPMALDVPALVELRDMASARGLVAGVNFELRSSAAVLKARDLVEAGAIGDITAIRIRTVIDKTDSYWLSGPRGAVVDSWRSRRESAGGGVVLMNSIHQIDLVRHITGLSFRRASAEVATLAAPVDVEDTASASLMMSNGAIATLAAAAHSPGAADEEVIEIEGTRGRLNLPDAYGVGPLRFYVREDWKDYAARTWHVVPGRQDDCQSVFLSEYVRAILDGGPPPAGPEDAIAALATVQAIYRSSMTGSRIAVVDA
ncbi:Gfo/Idh/MocA family oxidoreductase [Kribbella ginsengisoli]|uniref:Gfo/Idh/MocA family oxidoreductase n=1 Tax=Kribbella ginsengisoli TaxID=363865 RepID=A0ABP6Z8V0_9ACTN